MSTTFYTGNTGRSTGPHLDMRVFNPATGQYEDPSGYTSYLTQDGNPFNFQVTSGYGMRDHKIKLQVKVQLLITSQVISPQ